MDHAATTTRVTSALAGIDHEWIPTRDSLPTAHLTEERALDALSALAAAGFETMTLVTAIDHQPRTPRFELVRQLLSVAHGERVRLVTHLGEGALANSAVALWPGAAFMERECYDMFGIEFAGHPGLKRLLMPEEYEHFPLRKDFPHEGIEPDRLYREWDRQRRAEWKPEDPR
jgi:NADH:ubiquinone oxidoreductase subunit C